MLDVIAYLFFAATFVAIFVFIIAMLRWTRKDPVAKRIWWGGDD